MRKSELVGDQGSYELRRKEIKDPGGHMVKVCVQETGRGTKCTNRRCGPHPNSAVIRHPTFKMAFILSGIHFPNW